ncbi:hypothetical protein C9I98_20725 [Photobacterium sanctipauli]|uniref:Asparaginyl-tRNA synthetase n=1 Tax=Photobacterium sanctipauli TaxID=1342794 RepID=A0A2T3NII7_9GAMM|nr:hypothetical protein [Photobacterium sanctipauli]PSW15071.1 hypothetical protein C9I98_20725 [Photobacterium sanctipauli]
MTETNSRVAQIKSGGITTDAKLIMVAILCALLLIGGHLLLAKELVNQGWVKYTVAAIPFVLFAIGAWAVWFTLRLEANAQDKS